MSEDGKYLAAYFDEKSWKCWGITFTSSLNYLSKFNGQVVVVDFGMPEKACKFLSNLDNYSVIPADKKYVSQKLNFIHTVCNHANQGLWAFWDNTCYFQDDINEIFNSCGDKLVCCRGTSPLPHTKQLLGENTPIFLFETLKKISRIYGKPLGEGFMAGSNVTWNLYGKFIDFCIDYELFPDEDRSHQFILNLFACSFDHVNVLEDIWCQNITEELRKDDGFYCLGGKAKVIRVQGDMQYSADSAAYHYKNCFPGLYEEWLSRYKGCSFTPKRILKFKSKARENGPLFRRRSFDNPV